MKQKWMRSDTPISLFRKDSMVIFFFSISAMLSSCFLKQDRTTTVYGTITDQNGLPVDSILVIVKGVQFLKYDALAEMVSDQNGNYELMIDVPKKFSDINVVIPFGSSVNPKFQKLYKDFRILRNDVLTNNCCTAQIGEKTKYDFQLTPK
jgi:hypothetical protein